MELITELSAEVERLHELVAAITKALPLVQPTPNEAHIRRLIERGEHEGDTA